MQLNPLDQLTWIRLGYAALECEKWELATKAYQHATELDSEVCTNIIIVEKHNHKKRIFLIPEF